MGKWTIINRKEKEESWYGKTRVEDTQRTNSQEFAEDVAVVEW